MADESHRTVQLLALRTSISNLLELVKRMGNHGLTSVDLRASEAIAVDALRVVAEAQRTNRLAEALHSSDKWGES